MYYMTLCVPLVQGHQYAVLAASERASKAPENDSHKTVYSSIDPKSQVPRNINTLEKQSIPPKHGKNKFYSVLCLFATK